MPRAYSLQSSLFPLFPPVKTCLRTGLLASPVGISEDCRNKLPFRSVRHWLCQC